MSNTNEESPMVNVVDAPGYEEFSGNLVHVMAATDDRGDLGYVRPHAGSIHDVKIIPMKYVHTV